MAHSFPQNQSIILDLIKELNPGSIFEIGVGAGDYGVLIRQALPDVKLDGLEIYEPYRNHQWDEYGDVWLGDMRTFDYEPCDLFLMIDSLEHIPREEGMALLGKLRKLGKVLISVPLNYKQGQNLAPYDEHLAEYTLEDFEGYTLNGSNNLSTVIVYED